MEKIIVITLFFAISQVFSNPTIEVNPCALKACHEIDPNRINVHLVPHSHDDVGWIKSVEDYFYGERNEIRNVGIQYILDSVVQALKRDPNRRYIQVETAYFWKWWKLQSDDTRKVFKGFVDSGTIEMVGGGWTMNDEACVNYQSTINQMAWGLRLLDDTLGECGHPKIGWQIDPFGHSQEQASIFKQMGYGAFFFWRLSEDDRKARKNTKDLEFLWTSNENFEQSEIFTSIMDTYYSPADFCWDYFGCASSGSDGIDDDPESFDYNLPQKVQEFADHIANYSSWFQTNNILLTMGGDFQYQGAEVNYLNMDKLIKGFENHTDYNVFYSTPSCYVEAVKSNNPNLTIKTGDFFPYNNNELSYWTGYFTSRSTLKRFERTGNNMLQAAQQINAFAKMQNIITSSEAEENIRYLREAVSTMQHHDAITGTERETVAYDYSRMLTESMTQSATKIASIVGNLLKLPSNGNEDVNLHLSLCLSSNISVCENSMKTRSVIVLYNPLPKYANYLLRLPVVDGSYTLTNVNGSVDFDLAYHMPYPKVTTDSSLIEIVAKTRIPPMGLAVYYLEKIDETTTAIKPTIVTNTEITLGNEKTSLTFDTTTRKQTITMNDITQELDQSFMYYRSNNGVGDHIASGAYLFRPVKGTGANTITDHTYEVSLSNGTIVNEFVEHICGYITQTCRIMTDPDDDIDYIEYDWIVGPLNNNTVNTKEKIGKEIIVRYSLPGTSSSSFYTDSNGRQMIERTRKNPYNPKSLEPVSSNYYPVTSRITLEDMKNDVQLSVLTDRSQGGGSLNDDQIELMIHRRTLVDDNKGLGETLQEQEYGDYIVTRGSHYVIINQGGSSRAERLLALNKLTQPLVLVGDATSEDMTLDSLQKKINFAWSGLAINNGDGLSRNIHVLNFEPWKDDTYILRLEHIFGKNEDTELSEPVSLEMKYLFEPYRMASARELYLGGNEFKEDKLPDDNNFNITLSPMEIRTFLVTFSTQNS